MAVTVGTGPPPNKRAGGSRSEAGEGGSRRLTLVAANSATEERDKAARPVRAGEPLANASRPAAVTRDRDPQTAAVKETPHEAARTAPPTEEFPAERIRVVAGRLTGIKAPQTAAVKETPREAARTAPPTEEFPAERIEAVAGRLTGIKALQAAVLADPAGPVADPAEVLQGSAAAVDPVKADGAGSRNRNPYVGLFEAVHDWI